MDHSVDHYYKTIDGWAAFEDLYRLMADKAQSGQTFVEVGSWLGRSAALMGVELLKQGKQVKLFCVDPWVDGGPDLKDTHFYKKLRTPVYDLFIKNTQPIADAMGSYFIPLRMSSVQAANSFSDESVDFIMLDGDHSYEAVLADIEAWLPKMKKGSIMSGDDYLWPGVERAVDEQFGSRVKPVIRRTAHDYRKSVAYWWVQLP